MDGWLNEVGGIASKQQSSLKEFWIKKGTEIFWAHNEKGRLGEFDTDRTYERQEGQWESMAHWTDEVVWMDAGMVKSE